MLKNDKWIAEIARMGMIEPFEDRLVRAVPHQFSPGVGVQKVGFIEGVGVISYGLSSYGYDLRLSPKEFKVFRHIPGTVVDPKNFNPANLESVKLHNEHRDGILASQYFILPAHSYGLGVAMERVKMPSTVTGLLLNKSTYVRCGLLMPATVIEAGWQGHVTMEFSNSSNADVRIYAGEGIAQLLFFEGDRCSTTYADRSGKYQDQPESIVVSRV